MKIRVKDYMVNFPVFKRQVEARAPEKHIHFISEYSAVSFVPLAVVFRFYTMIYGPSEEIETKIKRTLAFSDNSLEEL